MNHTPVLFTEVMDGFAATPRKIERYLDGTLGRGGHLHGVLNLFPEIEVVAVDQDEQAIRYAEENFKDLIAGKKLRLIHRKFSQLDQVPDLGEFDIILLDLGVSSPQLDEGTRGFSFYHQGPLDMRMDQRDAITAAEIVNSWSEDELNQLFRELGEIRKPYRVTRAIVHDRKTEPFATTQQLSGLIERVEGWSRKGHHPATQYFLALRLQVNNELSQLEPALNFLIGRLRDQGRLAVITFHSLEDRIVKQTFKHQLNRGRLVNKKVIAAKWEEAKKNPRARSAKLRIYEKGVSHES